MKWKLRITDKCYPYIDHRRWSEKMFSLGGQTLKKKKIHYKKKCSCTVGIWLRKIWILETSEKQTFTCLLFRCPIFQWWSEYWTKISPVFKWHLNTKLFGDWTTFDLLNTGLVLYSDPHCNENFFLPESEVSNECYGRKVKC